MHCFEVEIDFLQQQNIIVMSANDQNCLFFPELWANLSVGKLPRSYALYNLLCMMPYKVNILLAKRVLVCYILDAICTQCFCDTCVFIARTHLAKGDENWARSCASRTLAINSELASARNRWSSADCTSWLCRRAVIAPIVQRGISKS